ncbi:MAG: hypothetical protein JWO36_2474 [Myxococcales bacterium]|nr:hypothetical protein [Myxococcales bacterium]
MASRAFIEHTGELQVRIDAPSVAELFVEAARTLADVMGAPSGPPLGPWQVVALVSRDREALLVAWLNELIARTEIDHLLYADVVVDETSDRHLAARIRGAPISETRTAVKAATMHGLRIGSGPGGATATLILDV